MVPLTWYETVEQRQDAVDALKALSPAARRLLSEIVENTGVKRTSVSNAAQSLEDAGFVRIRELDGVFTQDVELLPTLWGEEALEVYDSAH